MWAVLKNTLVAYDCCLKRGNIMQLLKILSVICSLVCLPTFAFGQYDIVPGSVVSMDANCSSDDVTLSIDFNVFELPPSEFVGWVVERRQLGLCEPVHFVTEDLPWPELGSHHFDLTVTPSSPFFDGIYRIWALDAEGNKTFISWPSRNSLAHSECRPGPSTVGRFYEYDDGWIVFEACEEWCWGGLSEWDGSYPPGVAEVANTGMVMALYGEWQMGMHGNYLNDPSMEVAYYPCDSVVALERENWGTIKSMYR